MLPDVKDGCEYIRRQLTPGVTFEASKLARISAVVSCFHELRLSSAAIAAADGTGLGACGLSVPADEEPEPAMAAQIAAPAMLGRGRGRAWTRCCAPCFQGLSRLTHARLRRVDARSPVNGLVQRIAGGDEASLQELAQAQLGLEVTADEVHAVFVKVRADLQLLEELEDGNDPDLAEDPELLRQISTASMKSMKSAGSPAGGRLLSPTTPAPLTESSSENVDAAWNEVRRPSQEDQTNMVLAEFSAAVKRLEMALSASQLDVQSSYACLEAVSVAKEDDEVGSSAPSIELASCGKPQPGDIVTLGSRCPREFRQCPAVITEVAEIHCTVCVLDETRRFAIGECWPGFDDFEYESCLWRLGTQVVIGGLKRGLLDGFSGRIVAHPKQGHPTFLTKSDPTRPQLTLCVRLDDPTAAGRSSVLLEPRFLTPYAEHVRKVAKDLADLRATLGTLSDTAVLPENADHVLDQLRICAGA